MRWKSNKTKPVKNGLMDKIIYLDSSGKPHYNVPLSGWGRDARIDNKDWKDLKDDVWAWEYMDKFEQHFLDKTIKSLISIKWGIKCT